MTGDKTDAIFNRRHAQRFLMFHHHRLFHLAHHEKRHNHRRKRYRVDQVRIGQP